jgi:hypothetical protein
MPQPRPFPLRNSLVVAVALITLSLPGCDRARSAADRPTRIAKAQWEKLQARWSAFAKRDEAEAAPTQRVTEIVDTTEAEAPPIAERLVRQSLAPEILEARMDEYRALRTKSVLEIQPWRAIETIDAIGLAGETGRAMLVNINPTINAWYVLTLDWGGGRPAQSYHLVNEKASVLDLVLDPKFPYGIVAVNSVESSPCALWSEEAPKRLTDATSSPTPYVSLCEGRVTLRLPTEGRRTRIEKVTDFLRDNIWQGEAITAFVRMTFYQDAFLQTGELVDAAVPNRISPEGPAPARLAPEAKDHLLTATGLGIDLVTRTPGQLGVGKWYSKKGVEGIYVSAVRPEFIHSEILDSHRTEVTSMDEVERGAIAYLVAFDLSRFEVGFMVGTDHPRLGWSERVPEPMRDDRLPGPDGFDQIKPLVSTGVLDPGAASRVVATFTGGFKRSHGAFKTGDLALRNRGSHYGFIERGTILSKLQPGLATLYVLDDGSVEAKTWRSEDDALLPRIAFARQNGVPLIEPDPEMGEIGPGKLVSSWAQGNWSGSHEGRFRTLRAGICTTEHNGDKFLIYGYFSTATPSAMTRVFQAYGCNYAMLTDMNALEHTYLAIYTPDSGTMIVEHLIDEMSVLDQTEGDGILPRFVGLADNRDFFFLLRREDE